MNHFCTVDQIYINIKDMFNPLHRLCSWISQSSYTKSFLCQETQINGSHNWFSHLFEFNIKTFLKVYITVAGKHISSHIIQGIWDLVAKLGLQWDYFGTLIPFGIKSQSQDLIAAPALVRTPLALLPNRPFSW